MNCSVCVLYTFRIAREMVLLASSYFCYFSNISTILPQNLLLYIIIFFFFFPFFLFTHFRVRLFAHFYCSLSLGTFQHYSARRWHEDTVVRTHSVELRLFSSLVHFGNFGFCCIHSPTSLPFHSISLSRSTLVNFFFYSM